MGKAGQDVWIAMEMGGCMIPVDTENDASTAIILNMATGNWTVQSAKEEKVICQRENLKLLVDT